MLPTTTQMIQAIKIRVKYFPSWMSVGTDETRDIAGGTQLSHQKSLIEWGLSARHTKITKPAISVRQTKPQLEEFSSVIPTKLSFSSQFHSPTKFIYSTVNLATDDTNKKRPRAALEATWLPYRLISSFSMA